MVRAKTPVMRQFESAKSEHPDALLFFRMGDFYELFHEDAKEAARLLDITLTARNDGIPMAGVPVRSLDSYLRRLVNIGRRVAICEQIEDAKKAKGIVKRAVVRVVTPGTLTEDGNLDVGRNNYLVAVAAPKRAGGAAGLAWVDLSTGAFELAELPASALSDELARLEPAEILVSRSALASRPDVLAALDAAGTAAAEREVEPWRLDPQDGRRALCTRHGVADLSGFGLDGLAAAVGCAGALLSYLEETQKTALPHLRRPRLHTPADSLVVDRVTLRCLEVVANQRDAGRSDTLLEVVDRTRTAMGARLLRGWLTAPLARLDPIAMRHDAVASLDDAPVGRADLRDALRNVHDLERLTARVSTGRATPRDVLALGRSLAQVPQIRTLLERHEAGLLCALGNAADPLTDLTAEIERTISNPAPLTIREGGIIREGISEDLDRARTLARGAKEVLAEMQRRESERTGIQNLRVGYTSVFGYFLEVSRGQVGRVPEEWTRRQTLKNVERYITPELKELEEQILGADDRARTLEEELFLGLRSRIAEDVSTLLDTAGAVAEIDVLACLAEVASEKGWTRPTLDETGSLRVRNGRHPVLDGRTEEPFVPNDAELDTASQHVVLITGPNMAGKSTYIRQVALIALLAHVGSFVPADEARIGRVDRIMARVGASDDIAGGRSTFMVEMTETANILHNATKRSLVILDEVGRGTSTYDGVALAWAITEHLATVTGCRTLFATHYHELTTMPSTIEQLGRSVRNARVAVREWGDRVVFLRRIEEGGTDRSYGIHVARLAGLPDEVVERARSVLSGLETRRHALLGDTQGTGEQLPLFRPPPDEGRAPEHPVLGEVRDVDVARTTPLDALALLDAWQRRLSPYPHQKAAPPQKAAPSEQADPPESSRGSSDSGHGPAVRE